MKFKKHKTEFVTNRFYVKIKQCSFTQFCWYANKIGQVFLVSPDVFPPDYIIVDCLENKKGLFPMIKKEDAEIVTLTLTERILMHFEMANYERSTDWAHTKINTLYFQ